MRLLIIDGLLAAGVAVGATPPRSATGRWITTRGRVVDEQGLAIPGATVRVTGKRRFATSADAEGHFLLRRPARTDSLMVSA